MSKYGFNENELVKTVTDMIDKEGFHKREVTYGKQGSGSASASFEVGTLISSSRTTPSNFDVTLIAINIPADCIFVYCVPGSTDYEWICDVGETMTEEMVQSYGQGLEFSPKFAGANAAIAVDPEPEDDVRYYQAYAIDAEFKVIARVKATADLNAYTQSH